MKDQKENMSFNEKTAVMLTAVGGSMTFFWGIVIWYAFWILWNSFAPTNLRFDGQWFPLLLFISNLIQILYMPTLQVGQNIIHRHSQKRSVSQFEMSKKIEQIIEQIEALESKQDSISINILNEIMQLKNEFSISEKRQDSKQLT